MSRRRKNANKLISQLKTEFLYLYFDNSGSKNLGLELLEKLRRNIQRR